MRLENKQTKPSSKLFGVSKADKGNCKAEKEMFFLWLLLYPGLIDASLWMLQVYHLILSKDYNASIIKAIIDVPLYLYC